jgi:predicted RNA-binding protein with PUA-like domain
MPNTWIFQGNPEIWDVEAGVRQLERFNWGVRQHEKEIQMGDRVFIWISGRDGGIVAVAKVASSPAHIADNEDEVRLYPSGPPRKFRGEQLRVYLDLEKRLKPQIKRS